MKFRFESILSAELYRNGQGCTFSLPEPMESYPIFKQYR